MHKNDVVRLRHMLEAAKEAVTFAENKQRKDLDDDLILARAIVKSIEIIGEAAANVSQESRDKFSPVAWPSIIGMRNRLIHAYYDINLDVVWSTIKEDLPPLIVQLESILAGEQNL